jgi:selenocysteine lyase/cysteine desulfurase
VPHPSYKSHFSKFRAASDRLHFAAHSHHYWPDASLEGHQRAWLDAATHADQKWDVVFGEVVPAAQRHVARILNLSDPNAIAFAPSTHDFLLRLFSTFDPKRGPVRILTTDGEFHSFVRQSVRWEEAGVATVERVPCEPYVTFGDRFRERVRAGGYDWLFFSQVFFNSAFSFAEFAQAVAEVPDDDALVVVDGYHGFHALPTNLAPIESRAFYTLGGYKYAMTGEGACFLHCPPGYAARPVNTGWFAGFEGLSRGAKLSYPDDARRMIGATFDPTGIYRFVAIMDHWQRERLTVEKIHAHVMRIQQLFLARLDEIESPDVNRLNLLPDVSFTDRGHFLTFRTDDAIAIQKQLLANGVVTDARGDRLRFGFAIYHDEEDVAQLVGRLREILAAR